ncbi:MAG: hypothetical protein SWZ49_22625 [Cyanobacteriota bacterium]|nr:hypothetical protein [Cyanobacteriota bacterium]
MSNLAEKSKELGLAIIKNTLWLNFLYGGNVDYFHYICVLQSAQAAELLIKAKIAEINENEIYIENYENHRNRKTIEYSKLPDKLLKISNKKYKIPNKKLFDRFGKLRNEIQHLQIPDDRNLKLETMKFIFTIIDPLINDFWGINVLDYIADNSDGIHLDYLDEFIFEDLIKANISFRVPDKLKDSYNKIYQMIYLVKNATNFVVKKYGKEFIYSDKIYLINNELQEKFEGERGYAIVKNSREKEDIYFLPKKITEALNDEIPYEKWGV